jgi:hypothetical protein
VTHDARLPAISTVPSTCCDSRASAFRSTPADARITGLDVIRVQPGKPFTVAGFAVTPVGARHAQVFEDEPDCANQGYRGAAGGSRRARP